VWGASATNVFVSSESMVVVRYDGAGWDVYTLGFLDPLYGMWGSSADDVYAVGGLMGPAMAQFNGAAWGTVADVPGGPLNDVWGSSATDVWAVGAETIIHTGGGAWSDASGGVVSPFVTVSSVWGAGADDVFAVGEDSLMLGSAFYEFDGDSWSELGLGGLADSVGLRAVHGRSADDVYAVGEEYAGGGGAVIRYDGAGFELLDGPFDFPLADVWAAPTGELFAVGSGGVVACR
jgi:hypothetical protein